MNNEKCFACGKPIKKSASACVTRDGQTVLVGSDCRKKIVKAGEKGYQPPKGGPRLFA